MTKVRRGFKKYFSTKKTSQNREKIALEKEIIKWREEIKAAKEEEKQIDNEKERWMKEYPGDRDPDLFRTWNEECEKLDQKKDEVWSKRLKGWQMSMRKEWEWTRKWGGKQDPPILLFCGEEFNYQLVKERWGFKMNWQIVGDRDYHSDVIDFGRHKNVDSNFVRKKIREIWDYWEQGRTKGRGGCFVNNYPIILLKNIDKINNSELKKELLLILDPQKNTKYVKYQIKVSKGKTIGEDDIDLSRFVLVATTSTSNPQLASELLTKLKHIDTFWDKYHWWIFNFSLGIEIFVFGLLTRNKREANKQN